MALDLRPSLDEPMEAFGLPAVVSVPGEDAVETSVLWLPADPTDVPEGAIFGRQEPRKVLALRRDEVPSVPVGTVIEAAEILGGTTKTWTVEGPTVYEPDHVRVMVVQDATAS